MGEYFLISETFKSLKELIDFFITHKETIGKAGEILQTPVSKFDRWAMKCTDMDIVRMTGSATKFGEIYEGLDKRSNEKVIIKSYAGNRQESINAFHLEAEVLKCCNHPNVVQ